MAKLKPPYIENILTPFTISQDTVSIAIPFVLSRSVHRNEIAGAAIMIKNAISNVELINEKIENTNSIGFDAFGEVETQNNTLTFNSTKNNETTGIFYFSQQNVNNLFQNGQYYKIQIAFLNSEKEVGYYSSVGVAKCITKPQLGFDHAKDENGNFINTSQYEYVVKCQFQDGVEKISNYKFDLYEYTVKRNRVQSGNEVENNLIFTSGWKVHDTSRDHDNISYDVCYLTKILDLGKSYELKYTMETTGGYRESTSTSFEAIDSVNISLKNYLLVAEPDSENGTIIVKFNRKDNTIPFTALTHNFVLLRASSEDNYNSWIRISDLGIENGSYIGNMEIEDALIMGNSMILWEDFTVEHGVSYKYALQAYNSYNFFSNKIESNLQQIVTETGLPKYDDKGKLQYDAIPTTIYFEDMYLTDGERQLRIRFNPKVSSFKSTILETKIDTIGSQYPFFFRNGTVNYKEFPISGLISLLMDPHDKFKVGLYNIKTGVGVSQINGTLTDLTHENIKNERKFKMEVLNWLTNGKPKLFRSPAEGNFIVRLMNTSLSPNDTLGRMLHTFSCTAYEMAECTMENLEQLGFLNIQLPQYKLSSFVGEQKISVSQFYSQYKDKDHGPFISIPDAFYAKIIQHNSISSEYSLTIKLEDGSLETVNIVLGPNGVYEVPLYGKMRLQKIQWNSSKWPKLIQQYEQYGENASFTIQYAYYDLSNLTNFHFIKNITSENILMQHIGKLDYTDINNIQVNSNNHPIFEKPQTIATWGIREMGSLYWIRLRRRPLIPLFYNMDDVKEVNGKVDLKNTALYFNEACTDECKWEKDKNTSQQPLFSALYKVYGVKINNVSRTSYDTNRILDFNDINMTIHETLNGDSYTLTPSISSYFTEISDEELKDDNFYKFELNNESYFYTMDYVNGKRDYKIGFDGSNFELDTDLLVSTPITHLKINRGLILEMCYKCKDFHYGFLDSEEEKTQWFSKLGNSDNNYGITDQQYDELQRCYDECLLWKKTFEQQKEAWFNRLQSVENENSSSYINYLHARECYAYSWEKYIHNLQTIIWYLTKDQEVVIE